MELLSFFRRGFHYSRLKNVRVNRHTFVVERKYVVCLKPYRTEWKQVDYKTTHFLKTGCRTCPPDYLRRLLQTAF